MNFLFLGTGTSTGVPQIGCHCKVCSSKDKKNRRLRASVMITEYNTRLLIDSGPDLRLQLLNNNIDWLSGVLLSHEHYDHIGGLDDVRPLGNMQVYAEQRVLDVIKQNMPYCFNEINYPGVPKINLHAIDENSFEINHIHIQPIRVMHAHLPILGFRIGKAAYLTDIKTLDQKAIEQLSGLDLLVINALRIKPHISHLSLEESIHLAQRIDARQTFFTHISHDMGLHDEINASLPPRIRLSYDGLSYDL